MTENEAKSCIQGKLDCMNKCDVFDCKNTDECDGCNYCYSQGNFGEQKKAFDVAIQALEEIQQYRAIGTVEQCKNSKIIADERYKYLMDGMELLRKYSEIGTVEELQALKKKNDKDFELLLKAVKESYPMFKGAYVELDMFMGDVMRRFTRDRKRT